MSEWTSANSKQLMTFSRMDRGRAEALKGGNGVEDKSP
jgi:hypothetical protein